MLPSDGDTRKPTKSRGRVFDTRPSLDARNAQFMVRTVLPPISTVVPERKVWRRGAVLDQGQEGACVGHGVTGELTGYPVPVNFYNARASIDAAWRASGGEGDPPNSAQAMAFWLYRKAQFIDEWPGQDYGGTSVNAGMKIARQLGLIDSWWWGETRADLRDSLIVKGPVVLAIPWHSGMYDAPGGELRVSGEQVGWHCILANGYDPALAISGKPKREMFRLLNSWGTGWGNYGSAWMEADMLWNLIHDNGGELAIAVGRTPTATP